MKGETAIFYAAEHGKTEALKLLISKGALGQPARTATGKRRCLRGS
jgi:ankyrin repeat protein